MKLVKNENEKKIDEVTDRDHFQITDSYEESEE